MVKKRFAALGLVFALLATSVFGHCYNPDVVYAEEVTEETQAQARATAMGALDFLNLCEPENLINVTTSEEQAAEMMAVIDEVTKGLEGDYAKAEAIYKWVATNITYESDASVNISAAPYDVFKDRYAVCGGFSNLIKEMMNLAGIPAAAVVGYYTSFPHQWNAVYVGGEWVYADATATTDDYFAESGDFTDHRINEVKDVIWEYGDLQLGYYNGLAVTAASGKVVEIPDSYKGYPITSFSYTLFNSESDIEEITINANITQLEESTLKSYTKMKCITVAEGNPSYASHEGALFTADYQHMIVYPYSSEATEFTLPQETQSFDYKEAFQAENLENLYVEEGSSYFSSYDGAIYDSEKTQLLCIPKGKTSLYVYENATITDDAFANVDKNNFTIIAKSGSPAETYAEENQIAFQAENTAPPAKDAVIPDANQYEYQKQELVAFCHFGPNTFNEIEWGEHYGSSTPDEIFRLADNFDAETLVSSLKEAGFQKLIVTAKHHDGFCIWNSAYTTYDVESTQYATKNYDEKGGDVLWEISEACTKYDMDMGLYLSPWDIHEPSYGYKDANGNGTSVENDVLDYNDFYNNQLVEILSSPKYGNNGHFNEVWMDGAKGSGANAQEYDFQRWFTTIQQYEGKAAGYDADCMLFGAEAYTGVRWIGNEEGYSNPQTWSKSISNKTNNTIDSNQTNVHGTRAGYSNGNQWTVPEADSKITSGWFWGTTKKTPISMKDLANRYFESVGYNAVMLLNIPPNDKGQVEPAILARVEEFGNAIRETFTNNLAKNATITASEVRGDESAFAPENVLDGNDATYWTVNDDTSTGSLVLDLGAVKTFDVVSIEESIEFGQRITSFRVEYSTDGTTWATMEEGTTIGAKRLCRTAPVKAQYVKITVSTNDTNVYTSSSSLAVAKGTVPMIAEVGVYKASEGFELAAPAPDGMVVIDERDSKYTFTGNWNNESGEQFPINQTSKWCNSGAGFTVTFTGSKIYLVGTKDPVHGTANISIDGQSVGSINTSSTARALGQIIFESEDLTPGEHTLTLTATGTIGIDGAYVIDNGGLGMIGIENAEYVMNEDETINVKLIRTGGSTGTATVLLSPDPGTAIQDDYDTECITEVVFAEGETEKTAPVRTRRNTNATGEQYFIVGLTTETENLILGFNSKAKVRINDSEAITVEKLQELVDACQALAPNEGLYTKDSWSAFAAKITDAVDKIAVGNMSNVVLQSTYSGLEDAKNALAIRNVATDIYNADDRFQFPNIGENKVLEMEYLEQNNNTEGDNGYPLQITEKDWASNGKILNCLYGNDSAVLYYNALRTGTYTAVVTYRSGASNNSLKWSEAEGKITAGEVSAGASDGAGANHTATFTFEVTEIGAGVLTFVGGANKAPQLDKIEITATALNPYTYNVTKTAGENGTITGPDTVTENEDATFAITPNEGYLIEDVRVNGTSVGAVTTYTVEDVNADITIEVTYREKPFQYSAENPFEFPSEANESATLEMEYLEQNNNTEGDNNWPLQITEKDWASNGKILNCLKGNDNAVLYYNAPKAGTYTAVLTYRSGSGANSLLWSEAEGKITEGSVAAGASDGAGANHTVTFTFEVTKVGAGVLTFKGGASEAPQLDKIEITATDIETPDSGEGGGTESEPISNVKDHWSFDTLTSDAGSKSTGVLSGNNVSIADSDSEVFGKVLRFGSGTDNFMKLENYINTGANSTSFSMWYRYDTTIEESTANASAVLLQHEGSGRSILTLRSNGQYHTYLNATDAISDGTVQKGDWQHITVTFDQTTKKVCYYINGELDSEKDLGSNIVNAVLNLRLGAHKNAGSDNPHPMRGDVDEFYVFERALTAEEAKAVYEEKALVLYKEKLAALITEADNLYENGEVDTSHAVAVGLNNAITAATAAKEKDNVTMAELTSAYEALETAMQTYWSVVPVTLTVDADTVQRTIDSDSIFGINHRYAFNGYGSFDSTTMTIKEEFKELYEEAGFGSIRYPGGTISNLFNWKTTIGPVEERKNQIHGFYNNSGQGGIAPNFGIGEIATFADSVDSEIVYVYSLGRGNAQDAADLIEYLNAQVGTNPNGGIDWAAVRAENGHPEPYNVRYFEIGNEMNQVYSDGTSSQGYWLHGFSDPETAYIDGGTASFTNQYAVCEEDWNAQASKSDGSANMVRYMRYANTNPKMYDANNNIVDDPNFVAVNRDSVRVYVGGTQWTIVESFENSGASDQHVVVDYSTGAIKFGNGEKGAIPAANTQITVDYTVNRDGFIKISQAMKETTAAINEAESASQEAYVYTSYETNGFITKMNDRNANEWYDGMTIHPYSGTVSGGSNADTFYDNAMKLAEDTGVGKVQGFVDRLPEGKVPVISEYGIFRNTEPQLRSQTHAIYIAKTLMEYVRLGSPYIQKHCLIDWYSSGGDSLGPTQQAVIQAVAQEGASTKTGEGEFDFFATPSAHVFQMLNAGFGDYIIDAEFDRVPEMENGVDLLSVLASKDDFGNIYLAIVNVDREMDRNIILDVAGLEGCEVSVQKLTSDSITEENSLEEPDNVTVTKESFTATANHTYTVEKHSIAVLKINTTGKADKNPLQDAIEKAESLTPALYEDFTGVQTAVAAGNAVMADADATAEDIANAVDAIEAAINALRSVYPDDIEAELAGYTLSLEGTIGVNFHMQLGDEVLKDAGAYMNFALGGKEYMQVPVKDATIDDETGYYVFKCGVPVKDMETEITARIILSDGRRSAEFKYTIQEYADKITSGEVTIPGAKPELVEATKELVEAMSDFGDYASAYFEDGNLDETSEMEAVTAETLEEFEGTFPENSVYYGSSLLLKSNTILRHYFTEEVEGSTQKGNLYYIESEGIPAHNLGKEIVTEVGDMEITYNPLSYAYIALSREDIDENLKSVMRAMYLYYQAAQDYLEETTNN